MRRAWIGLVAGVVLLGGCQLTAGAAGLDEALRAFRAGDFAAAQSQIKTALAGNPGDLGARFWLGRCLVEQRQFAPAETELRRVLAGKPDSTDALHWLGVALAGQGKTDEARVAFGKVLERRPGDKDTVAALARLAPPAGVGPAPRSTTEADADRRVALSADGLAVDVGQVDVLSRNVYDYTWSSAPTDWVTGAGTCKNTNRWQCSPQWSWYGAYDPEGVAATWNKHQFVGDVTVEIYAAMKMGVGMTERRYKNPNDMNLLLQGDGANLDSGYSFMFGADENRYSCIMKGGKILAKTEDRTALFPIFEDAYPKDMYEFHRKWWALRARQSGDKLQFFKDEKLILETQDPHPLTGGRVAIWTMHNGLIVSRVKIYYEDEKAPPDPLPIDALLETPPVSSLGQRAVTIDSDTHPAIYDDFETDLGHWQTRADAPGVRLSLVSPGAEGKGHALAITDQQPGGLFCAQFKTPRLDARKYGRLSFDYQVDPDAKLNLQIEVNSGTYEVVFTAPGELGPQAQELTQVPDVKADGKWHHADVDLIGYLDRVYKPDEPLWIEDVYFANTHRSHYTHAGFGGNHAGDTLQIDNFCLAGAGPSDVVLNWHPASGVNVTRCAYLIDGSTLTQPREDNLTTGPSVNASLPRSGVYYAHFRPQLADGSWGPVETRAIMVDRDPPVVASRTPDAGESSGSSTISVRLTDAGAGVDRKSVKFTVQGKPFGLDAEARILRYEPKDSLLTFAPGPAGLAFADGQPVSVELEAADRVGRALEPVKWQWKYAAARDKTPPTTPVVMSDDAYLCRDDFENSLDQWNTFGGPDGAVVCRDPSTMADGQYSLRLCNYRQGSRFGAYVRREAFNAGKYRLMSFDYNASGRLRTDFALYVADRWKSIRFFDTDNPQPRIGEISGPQADGQWHHAEVNLYDMLRTTDPAASSYAVRYLILGDWGYTGQPAGRTYYMDNFQIAPVISGASPVGFSWQTFDTSGIAGASYAFDQSPTTDPGTKKMTDGAAVKVPAKADGLCWFHVRSVDKAGNWSVPAHLRVLVDRESPTVAVVSPQPGERAAASQIVLKLADTGPAGIDPETIKLKVAGQQYDMSGPVMAFNGKTSELVWDGNRVTPQPVTFTNGQTVSVELVSAADFAGNPAKPPAPFTWTMDYAKDDAPPAITSIRSATHLTYVSNTFENGLDQWVSSTNDKGGKLELDTTTAASGHSSLKVTNTVAGGSMRAIACSEGFSADRSPIISFDYNLSPGVKFDLLVLMDDQWYAIAMTNDPRAAVDRIPGAVADGKWHHATVALAEILRTVKRNGALDVQQVVFGDREPFNNAVGAVAHLDNFIIGRVGRAVPSFRWTAADATGITDYSYALDQNPTTVPEEVGKGPAANATFRTMAAGEWYFHVRARDGAGHWGPAVTYAILHLEPRPNQ